MRWEAHSPPVTWSSHTLPSPVADLCQDGRGGCSEHANCSQVGTVVTCACLPDYEGDGWSCQARNPCEDGHRGGCSEHADCLSTGPVSRGAQRLGGEVPVGSQSLKGTCLLSCPRTHGAVCATPAMWVMDCSVWRSPSHPWTVAWASPHRVTWMPCAQTCTSRVSFPACSVPVSYLRAPADCIPPSLLQRNGLVSSTSRPPAALTVSTFLRLRRHVGPRELSSLLFLSSPLPSRCVGPRSMEPGLWEPLELGLGSQHPPTLQLGFHLCLVGWLANGSAARPVVFPEADCGAGQVGVVSLGSRKNRSEHWDAYCYRMQGAAAHHASLPCSAPSHRPTNPLNPRLPQMWPADAAMALWVMGSARATESCLMY